LLRQLFLTVIIGTVTVIVDTVTVDNYTGQHTKCIRNENS